MFSSLRLAFSSALALLVLASTPFAAEPVCDLRKEFQDYLKKNNPDNKEKGILTRDRVHLNDEGNQRVAEAMLKMLGH